MAWPVGWEFNALLLKCSHEGKLIYTALQTYTGTSKLIGWPYTHTRVKGRNDRADIGNSYETSAREQEAYSLFPNLNYHLAQSHLNTAR